jgi:hypothetical protein
MTKPSKSNLRHLMLFVGLFLCTASVFGLGQGGNGKDANIVKTRLNQIYHKIFASYTSNGPSPNRDTFDKKFTTADYQLWLQKVNVIDNKHPEEIGFFDYDHWIMAQDWNSPSLRVNTVKMISSNEARANVTICDNSSRIPLTLILKRQNGIWLIDDFITQGKYGSSEKKGMQKYAKENSR